MKRLFAWLLALTMALGMLPNAAVQVLATEEITQEPIVEGNEETTPEETEQEPPGYELRHVNVVVDADLPDPEELHTAYAEKVLYGEAPAFYGIAAGARLTGDEKQMYDALVPIIRQIASGERSTTVIGLGQTVTYEGETYEADAAVSFTSADLTNEMLRNVITALISDLSYEMYWYDKVAGCSAQIFSGSTLVHAQLMFHVADNYQGAGNYTTDTGKTGLAAVAAETAGEIVARYAGKSDYEKLLAYRDEICSLVSYDDAAAESGNFSLDNDPWQLIHVFDGDPSTNVVCEGYSKAFMYLCDRTDFSGQVCCYLVNGTMDGGAHMWNVVTLEGKNYLVDVTNSDAKTIGQNGGLFLAGAPGSAVSGYTLLNCAFIYDEKLLAFWGSDSESILTLAETDYIPDTTPEAPEDPDIPDEPEIPQVEILVTADGLHYTAADTGITIVAYSGNTQELIFPAQIDGKPVVAIDAAAFADVDQLTDIYYSASMEQWLALENRPNATHFHVNCPDPAAHWQEERMDADCERAGYTRQLCACGYERNYVTLEALGHSYEAVVTPPGCTEQGYTTHTCHCGDSYVDTFVPPLEHAWDEGMVTTEPTEQVPGVRTYTCANCGDTQTEEIPVLEHTHQYTPTVTDPTCTQEGYTLYQCSCGESYEEDSVEALGHAYEAGICVRCGHLEDWNWREVDGTVVITRYTGTDTEVVVPANIAGKSVTTVGDSAFADCVQLKKVTLPAGITTLEAYAFAYCYNLTGINIPDTVTTIGNTAFANCESLKSVVIPEGVKRIESDTFFNCYELQSVSLPDGITYIGEYAFGSCYQLTDFRIPAAVTDIDDYAFRFCTSITEFALPAGLTKIGEGVFSGCHALRSIEIPQGVTTIAYEAFHQCRELGSVTMPESVITIEERAFAECGNLTCVVYAGTKTQKENISIAASNKNLTGANWHYNGGHCDPQIREVAANAQGKPEISWNDMACMRSFAIYRATSSGGEYTYLASTTGNSFADETAQRGKRYYYKLLGITDSGESTDLSTAKSCYCVCERPVVSGQTNASGKPVLSWNAVDGAVKYEVWRATVKNGSFSKLTTTTSLYYTNSSATAGKVYYYKVKAVAASSTANSGYSEIIEVGCRCTQPSVKLTLNTTSGKPALSWSKVTGAKLYGISRAYEENGTYEQLDIISGTSFQDKTAPADTLCFYKVIAIAADERSNSQESVPKSIQATCAKPVIKTATDTVTGVATISWDAVDGAVSYVITRATKSSGTYTQIDETDGLSFRDQTASAGKTYYYKVTAVTASGARSAASSYKSGKRICAQPVITVQTNPAKGKAQVSWEKISGAKKYEVYRATSAAGKYSKLTTTTKLAYTDTSASVGKTYYYKVKAIAASTTYNSSYSQVLSCYTICAQPSVSAKVNTTTGKPSLSWSKITGASKYEILRATEESGIYESLVIQTAVSYQDTSALADTTYFYKVNALATNEANNSMDATPKMIASTCAKPVVKGAADVASGKPALTWEAVEGAVSYEIRRATKSSGTYTLVDCTDVAAYVDETAVVGKTYYYKVTAVAENSRSVISAYKSVTCKCAQPVIAIGLNEKGDPVLTWQKVEKAQKYEIYRATSETGKYSKVKTTTALTYTHSTATAGKTYYYKVKAIASSSSGNSVYSAVVSIQAQ